MKILLIEDEQRWVDDARELFSEVDRELELIVASNRDDGIAFLISDDFDLVVCDLKIPPQAGSLDADEDHGLAVFAASKQYCPGTPVIFLTARATVRNTSHLLAQGQTCQVFGIPNHPMVQLSVKDEPLAFRDSVRRLAESKLALETITGGGSDTFNEVTLRAVRMYGHTVSAQAFSLARLAGSSSTEIGIATYTDSDGRELSAFFKVLSLIKAERELDLYHRYVATRLGLGDFAPLVHSYSAGLRGDGAIFYKVAPGSRNLFSLANDAAASGEILGSLRAMMLPWTSLQTSESTLLGDLRRARTSDLLLEDYEQFIPHRRQVEELRLELPTCITHGDLHGANVLISPDGRPVLIDFADASHACSALDPLTLETSLLFHPSGPARSTDWPTVGQAERWFDLDVYTEDCPFEGFVRETRGWALDLAGEVAVLAAGYVHAVRQLRYGDVDHELSCAIARGAAERLLALS